MEGSLYVAIFWHTQCSNIHYSEIVLSAQNISLSCRFKNKLGPNVIKILELELKMELILKSYGLASKVTMMC